MPAFPDDILFLIVEELKQLLREDITRHDRYSGRQPKLAPYAGVSRQWNAIIERETSRHIHVSSTNRLHEGCRGEAPDQGLVTTARFKQMMNRDPVRRRQILRHITFVASHSFSIYSTMGQSEAGRTTNDEHFSRSVHEFWKILERWEQPLSLKFVQAPVMKGDWSRKSPAWLNLIGDPLPPLRCVTSFSVDDELVVWPSSLMAIIASLTHLTNVKLILHDEIEDSELRRRWREDLGHGISQISITCRDFYARFADRSHGFDEPPAVAPGAPDTFCINLRTLSTHLRHLHLEQARISAALFWPGADKKSQASLPSWPHLETLLIELEPVDSYGRFYADPTPEEFAYNASHNDLRPWDPIEHVCRAVPRPERSLYPLLAAAGRAAQRMPRLMQLTIQREDDTGFAAKLELYENHVDGGKRKDGRIRWSWYITPDVRLADHILEAWGLQWDEVEVWEEEGDGEGENGSWTAEALIPWR